MDSAKELADRLGEEMAKGGFVWKEKHCPACSVQLEHTTGSWGVADTKDAATLADLNVRLIYPLCLNCTAILSHCPEDGAELDRVQTGLSESLHLLLLSQDSVAPESIN
jgi:hypothetical protein